SVAGLLAMLDDPLSTHNPSLSVSTVSVVNTSRPPVSQTAAPPLEAGEVALFIPGIGTERGRSISDVNFVNANGASAVGNLRVYYTPETSQTASARADLPLLAPGSLVSYGNIIGSVFQSESTGTLQIRAGGAIESITASARVLNIESRDGTFGTAIPVFRSDRAVEPGGEIVLTGVRKDANTITNLFIQEMSGNPARFDIRFLDGNGAQTGGSYSGDVNPFSLRRVLDQVPTGTVTAVVTNARDSAGRIGAYATPRDTRSGDFWSVVDWSRTFGFQRFEPMVIPFVESARGVDKFSRSDLVISNRASSLQKGTLRFISPSSPVIESLVALDAGKSRSLADLLGESFHLTSGEGYLLFAPQCDAFDESLGIGACDAAFSLASRNFASGSDPGTYGTAVPALGLASALRSGQSRLIGGIEDVERSRGPGTYRTEVGLLETAGAPATVRITVLTRETRGTISFVSGTSRDILLGPREYKKINGIATYVLGGGATGVPGSGGTGRRRAAGTPRSVLSTSTLEIRNASLLFQVLSGDGAVIVFASAIDNGTGDALLRVE
ncbi:MAG TPA: hypothetical protein VFL80_11320, partial [Thermoanaerobaculia bacterium]|nr:hypothetical protein [Thermoanaerobaculia bacterium]